MSFTIFGSPIKSRVMKAINARIEQAEKAFKDHVEAVDALCDENVEKMYRNADIAAAQARIDAESAKEDMAKHHVNSILGKII